MIRLFAALTAVCAAPVAAADLFSILSLDGSRTGDSNEGGGPRFLTAPTMVDATNILLGNGFTIRTTDRLVSDNFGDAHILYTGAVREDFSAAEINDTAAFVAGGGCLILQRDWGDFYPASDPLAAAFGVSYDIGPYGLSGVPTAVVRTAANPIWDGPAGSVGAFAQVVSSGLIGVDPIGEHSSDAGVVAIGTKSFGQGRVIFLTDMDAWDSVGDSVTPNPLNANGIVWANIFLSCVPEPSSLLLLGAGAMLLRLRR